MGKRDEFSKWLSTVEEALEGFDKKEVEEDIHSDECGCGYWDCETCFPPGEGFERCPSCGEEECACPQDDISIDIINEPEFEESSVGGMGAGCVAQYEEENIGGSESPLTFGSELEEQDVDPSILDDEDDEDRDEIIGHITYMQDLGLSKSDKHYNDFDLKNMPPEELKKVRDEVMGEVPTEDVLQTKRQQIEKGPNEEMNEADFGDPRKAKPKIDDFDDVGDILNPKTPDLPTTTTPGGPQDIPGAEGPQGTMDLPTASAASTRSKVAGITPSEIMRDYMNRINPAAGGDEPVLPVEPRNELVPRVARDVPAVINTAMQRTGMQSPEWHTIDNLPGYSNRNIRGMGRQMFGMITNTPLEQIKTIANVNGQGPNTDAELRAVANWLVQNAEDLGEVRVRFGMAIPGYEPEVREYRANGIRFHVVRDPMGQYIYAYPERDAISHERDDGEQGQLGGPMPRLRESLIFFKPTLYEQLKWDEELFEILGEAFDEDLEEEMLDESTLSRLVGKQPGAKNLIKWLHKKHRLGSEAEIVPARMSNKRLLWTSFKSNPDQFIIVIAENGVAGIKPDEKHILDKTAQYQRKGKIYNPGGDSSLPYEIVAFTDDGQEIDPALLQPQPEPGEEPVQVPAGRDPRVMKARMGLHTGRDTQNVDNVFNLLAEQIGRIQSVYLTGEPSEEEGEQPEFKGGIEREKIARRAELKSTTPLSDREAIDNIFKRVRPVLKRLADQASSQINRGAQRFVNAGNFRDAQSLMQSAERLKDFMVSLDRSGEINLDNAIDSPTRDFTNAIFKAIEAASGSKRGTPAFSEWINDAASGNSVALKPVLDAIRETLVRL